MEEDFKFLPHKGKQCDREHVHAMMLPYFTMIYNCMRHEVSRKVENKVVWTDEVERSPK